MRKDIGAQAIVFPTPVFILTTYKEDGTANAMQAAWGGICSSEPPCLMVSIRKNRCTYENILRKNAFAVNIPDVDHLAEADYFGISSGNKVNKFEKTGLTAVPSNFVAAPVIKEFPIAIECKCVQMIEIGKHVMMVGEIQNVSAEERVLTEKDIPDLSKVRPIAYNPADNNYNTVTGVVGRAFSAGKKFI